MVLQILADAGDPTTGTVVAPARSSTVEVNAQRQIASEAVEAIPEIEFDQMANSLMKDGQDKLVADAGGGAEPVRELEFDKTLPW